MRAILSQRDLRNALGPASILPKVDFTKEMVIVVSMGRQPSGGYQIRITKVVDASKTLRVEVMETLPGKSCLVTDMETYPCDIVLIKKSNKPLTFQTSQNTKDCQ
jgi:hypothetical protein